MSVASRIRRKRILHEAEGYLDLIYVFGDDTSLPAPLRDRLAQRALDALDRLPGGSAVGAGALQLRGQALRAMQRYAEAIAPLQAAVEIEPSDIHAYLALGWCYKRTGRLDQAIQSLEAAIEADPAQAILHYNLACYWSLAGNKDRAIECLQRALSMDPSFRYMIDAEADFDPIRDDPGFQAITTIIV